MNLRENTCCFTGHREIPANQYEALQAILENRLRYLIDCGYNCFCCGAARGFDTLAAKTVWSLKQKHPEITLRLFLPYQGSTEKWSKQKREEWHSILADSEYAPAPDHYFQGCFHQRDRAMVDESNCCMTYLTKESGGTQYTVQYARKQGIEVIDLTQFALFQQKTATF